MLFWKPWLSSLCTIRKSRLIEVIVVWIFIVTYRSLLGGTYYFCETFQFHLMQFAHSNELGKQRNSTELKATTPHRWFLCLLWASPPFDGPPYKPNIDMTRSQVAASIFIKFITWIGGAWKLFQDPLNTSRCIFLLNQSWICCKYLRHPTNKACVKICLFVWNLEVRNQMTILACCKRGIQPRRLAVIFGCLC